MQECATLKMMMISEDCFIKPKFVSEEAQKPTYLAPWDLAMLNLTYIQKGLLYSLPPGTKIDNFVHRLKDSLSETLTHFHPLAGRLATVKQQTNPPSVAIFINPDNSPGARFIHASVNLTIDDLLTPTDVPMIVESFFDHHKTIGHDGHQKSLVSIQVTELVDGIFVGCSMSHTVADGTSFWHFFNSLSQVFQSKPIVPPVLKRWVPEGYEIISLPFTHEDEYVNRPNPPSGPDLVLGEVGDGPGHHYFGGIKLHIYFTNIQEKVMKKHMNLKMKGIVVCCSGKKMNVK